MGWTVVVVDDHVGFRSSAAEMLRAAGHEVVAACADGRSALAAIAALRPDVVLLDVQLPDASGFGVAEALAGDADPPRVILVSSRDRSDYGGLIDESGARGFLSKDELSGDSLRGLLQ